MADVWVTTPPLSAYIWGDNWINTAGEYEWVAVPSGGVGGYTYVWHARWDGDWLWHQVGSSSTYKRWIMAGDPSFTLRLTVTSGSEQVVDQMHVWVSICDCEIMPH